MIFPARILAVIGNVRACGQLENGMDQDEGNEHYLSDIGSLIPEIYEAKIHPAPEGIYIRPACEDERQ